MMPAEEKLLFRKQRIVDEIIQLGKYDKNTLLAKARFLNRTKAESAKHEWRKKIETSVSNSKSGNAIAKRTFDIIVSSLLLILLAPFFFLIAVAIRLESRGPIFYIAKRAGRGSAWRTDGQGFFPAGRKGNARPRAFARTGT